MIPHAIPILILSAVPVAGAAVSSAALAREARTLAATQKEFEALHARKDRDACLALWRESPHWILPTLSADLERSLALAEAEPVPGAQAEERTREIAHLQERALWGARLAAEATGGTVVVDYVASFVGWSDHDRSMYRQQQAILARTDAHLGVGQYDEAAETARECIERAAALGDQLGVALADVRLGQAEHGRDTPDDALIAFARARDLFHDLGLLADEYAAQATVAILCEELRRDVRGIEAADRALELGKRIDALGIERPRGASEPKALLDARAKMQERVGQKAR